MLLILMSASFGSIARKLGVFMCPCRLRWLDSMTLISAVIRGGLERARRLLCTLADPFGCTEARRTAQYETMNYIEIRETLICRRLSMSNDDRVNHKIPIKMGGVFSKITGVALRSFVIG